MISSFRSVAFFLFLFLFAGTTHASGELDSTFGTGGIVLPNLFQFEAVYAVAIQTDGKILSAGYTNNEDFLVVRFNNDGSLDVSFGSGGIVITNFGSNAEIARSIVIQ